MSSKSLHAIADADRLHDLAERRYAAADRLARAESELAQARAARDRHDTEANRERVGRAFDELDAAYLQVKLAAQGVTVH